MILTNPGQYLQRKIKKKIWVAVPFFYVKRVSHIKIAFAAFVVIGLQKYGITAGFE